MKSSRTLPVALLLSVLAAVPVSAQTLQDAVIGNLETVRDKTMALARAIPQDKLGHKVHPDVRSLGEELMHIASSNFRYPTMIGVEVADVPEAWRAGTVESPEETARALDASFAYLFDAVRGITDLNATVNIRRRDMTMNAYLIMMITHVHEHLGKSISDARSAGIVPPWSEGQ
jgi:uncharacterized damage-inducible protein DinB